MSEGNGDVDGRSPRVASAGRAVVVAALCLGLLALVAVPRARALPHGCASLTRDFRAQFDPRTRTLGVEAHVDEPCTFVYAAGDTFSGSGRFTVSCATGGYFHHKDVHDGGDFSNPPVALVPIPQPCDAGAVVTIDGYHTGTGGAVIAGGLSSGVPLEPAAADSGDFHPLCTGGTPRATVGLEKPVNYSGLLTYTGTVECLGANVRITSLTATPLFEYPNPSTNQARCRNCTGALTASGTVPAEAWVFEVRMDFAVARRGQPSVTGHRVGRYVANWAGEIQTICPVGTDETCPA